MLYLGKDKVGRLYIGQRAVRVLYQGAVKIWEAVSSCFGSGFWRGDKVWKGTDSWKQ